MKVFCASVVLGVSDFPANLLMTFAIIQSLICVCVITVQAISIGLALINFPSVISFRCLSFISKGGPSVFMHKVGSINTIKLFKKKS